MDTSLYYPRDVAVAVRMRTTISRFLCEVKLRQIVGLSRGRFDDFLLFCSIGLYLRSRESTCSQVELFPSS